MGRSSFNSANINRNRESVSKILPIYLRLCQETGHEPTGAMLAKAAGCGTRQAHRILKLLRTDSHGKKEQVSPAKRATEVMTIDNINQQLKLMKVEHERKCKEQETLGQPPAANCVPAPIEATVMRYSCTVAQALLIVLAIIVAASTVLEILRN